MQISESFLAKLSGYQAPNLHAFTYATEKFLLILPFCKYKFCIMNETHLSKFVNFYLPVSVVSLDLVCHHKINMRYEFNF